MALVLPAVALFVALLRVVVFFAAVFFAAVFLRVVFFGAGAVSGVSIFSPASLRTPACFVFAMVSLSKADLDPHEPPADSGSIMELSSIRAVVLKFSRNHQWTAAGLRVKRILREKIQKKSHSIDYKRLATIGGMWPPGASPSGSFASGPRHRQRACPLAAGTSGQTPKMFLHWASADA